MRTLQIRWSCLDGHEHETQDEAARCIADKLLLIQREIWKAAVQRCVAEITSIWGADLITTQAHLDELLECDVAVTDLNGEETSR